MQFKGLTVSECSFDLGDREVCSSNDMIEAMDRFLSDIKKEVKSKDPETIITTMKKVTKCDTEACIYTASPFVTYIGPTTAVKHMEEVFKPVGPKTTDDLLSNYNIDGVLAQFARKYPGFLHIPFQMRDFQDLAKANPKDKNNLANVDFADEYRKGMKTFGCVLNTDWSTGGGYHWYCIFGDFTTDNPTIEYYNTSGNVALKETREWLTNTCISLSKALGKHVSKVQVLNKAIQDNDVDCGVYCLHYIWSRLEGYPYQQFSDPATAPNDSLMTKARLHLFRE
jgi:hypothetical protein